MDKARHGQDSIGTGIIDVLIGVRPILNGEVSVQGIVGNYMRVAQRKVI